MNSFIVIFPPRVASRSDFEAAVHQHAESSEFIDIAPAIPCDKIDDAEQLPLWRWFICSK